MSRLESLQKHDNQDIANSAGRALFVINPDSELSFCCLIISEVNETLKYTQQKNIISMV